MCPIELNVIYFLNRGSRSCHWAYLLLFFSSRSENEKATSKQMKWSAACFFFYILLSSILKNENVVRLTTELARKQCEKSRSIIMRFPQKMKILFFNSNFYAKSLRIPQKKNSGFFHLKFLWWFSGKLKF